MTKMHARSGRRSRGPGSAHSLWSSFLPGCGLGVAVMLILSAWERIVYGDVCRGGIPHGPPLTATAAEVLVALPATLTAILGVWRRHRVGGVVAVVILVGLWTAFLCLMALVVLFISDRCYLG